MPKSDPSDENSVLIKKLKHACATYDTASKKYLAAVKELDTAMESIAIAIRELAQGEESPDLREKADRLCSSVDRHMAGQGGDHRGGSKSQRASANLSVSGADTYTFVTYMNDFTREISAAIDELKESVKKAEKSRSTYEEVTSKYNKRRTAVSEMETKLAKKNQGISDNPKFNKKVAERDEAKITLDAETQRYNHVYSDLLQQRSKTLQRVIAGLDKYSTKYYNSLSKTISS
ncbi:hypothetical protein ABB37_02091 [Leptomonas pyrrhocoris]|uniref:BAR domain-containing protein n=1 Tax=Leptomonas pyrrhocoris TaxID=157538 RepID=A0A0N0DYA6_LEPPY|nr:hypothetical protein ABB37_02091 [Leptomonas pyrrhocoris]XP_015662368.1 hypothetical protein ABB37_02091 [Leptomonas pyrrhocoris]XP_015662369.1 hypothetical protein ABB37_02091 [Leptomonas pyrrhocoris]XP_015662370.1 hypothetical protein ABB37_02091 [Leptomonas pyrrhocoris]KPA83928.1 hypothetical protein ABB37_02091 [Leptomonas pyrrhocoris]KPA83929.1 hypothetical protein ABB37_02091 [Leptomonas pyrrhocoris]KPA83930.1 hypothetical protein ABB37_02091 [Leptomonas pyrrhocoris]KPA83931.1 hypot|eukprot:XP_015662367.1 hypothetical protein ABB37_02091 [Leptomonas pyrrhocoris]